jgi:hypothetical protein
MADTKKPPRERSAPPPRRSEPEASERWELDTIQTNLGGTLRLGPPSRGQNEDDIPRHAPVPRFAGKSIELFVVDETSLPGRERRPWRAAEVWTKRRVYGLDSTFRCIEILDRETGRPDPKHDMLGARLGGGRLREKDTARFSYPLPLPGMEAMFVKGKKHGYTSPIERMIVRVRVLHTGADEAMPSWDEIASRWSEPPP